MARLGLSLLAASSAASQVLHRESPKQKKNNSRQQDAKVLTEPRNNYPTEEATVRRAEEDWMRQMFSGTIHNIGNVITVARLAVTELDEANKEKEDVLNMILQEILPELLQHVENGSIGEFLTDDDTGSEYLHSLNQLLHHQKRILREQGETVSALNQKLNHITEIISLQQRLVSGVGRRETVAVDSLIQDAVKMMGESAHRHDVHLAQDLNSSGLVDIDPSMTTQVFINLIKNAIEALDELTDRERRLTIHSCTMPRNGKPHICCTFQDNANGMPPDILERIFDFGFTTKNNQGYGRGVGLNYCRRTIEKFNGALEVTSEKGQGTCFTVWLQVAEDDDL